MKRLLLVACLVALAAGSAVAAPEPKLVLVPGGGLGYWRIGMDRRVDPGLVRTVRVPKNALAQGCLSFIPHESAAVIDHYRGIRLAWLGVGKGRFYLNGVATTRRGDRSLEGFEIGKTRFAAVRALYRKGHHSTARELVTWGPDRLGAFFWSVYVPTGYETGDTLTFWFSRDGRLVALETGGSGC
jgi:hypothetical protein